MRFTLKKTAQLVVAAALMVPAANGAMTVAAKAAAELPANHICNTLPSTDPRKRPGGYCSLAVAKMYLHGGPNVVLPPPACGPKTKKSGEWSVRKSGKSSYKFGKSSRKSSSSGRSSRSKSTGGFDITQIFDFSSSNRSSRGSRSGGRR